MRGSSSRSGPAPDPEAIRRDRKTDPGWTTLPDKREGPVPPWPLGDATKRELDLWQRQWSRPQAVMWEANGQAEEVALYVRTLTDAERPGASVAARTLVVRQQETLGISLPGLARNRWRIGTPEPAKEAPKTDGRRRPSAKERLSKIIELQDRRPA